MLLELEEGVHASLSFKFLPLEVFITMKMKENKTLKLFVKVSSPSDYNCYGNNVNRKQRKESKKLYQGGKGRKNTSFHPA